MEARAVVECRGVTKRFGERIAVDALDLAVPAGVCFGILGPNGAGKTTTLKMIYGVTRPNAGEIRVFGIDVARRPREVRARLRGLEKGGAVPFAFPAHFPEVAGRGGFDVVIGNPPWVRLHRIPPAARERMRREFRVFRNAAWDDGAREARAGIGFGQAIACLLEEAQARKIGRPQQATAVA